MRKSKIDGIDYFTQSPIGKCLDSYALLFAKGNEKALDYYFRLYYPAICYFASRITMNFEVGEDIASQAFLKTWNKHAQLDNPESIRAYLFRVARNDCYKWLHQHKRELTVQKELMDLTRPVEESHLELVLKAEVLGRLHLEMQQLPMGCRKVFEKLYIEGKTIAETARELKLAITTVKTQKSRGLAALRKSLDLQ